MEKIALMLLGFNEEDADRVIDLFVDNNKIALLDEILFEEV